jgi:hypothetical protein
MSKKKATYEEMKKQLKGWKEQIDELDKSEARLKVAAAQATEKYQAEVDALRAQMETQVQTWRSEMTTVKAKAGATEADARAKLEALFDQIESQLDEWGAKSATLKSQSARWTRADGEKYIETLRAQHQAAREKLRLLKEPQEVRLEAAKAEALRAMDELKQAVEKAAAKRK